MGPYGPEAQAGVGIAPLEHFPNKEAAVLTGHEGSVLVVRFNSQGTYCLSGGKVRCCFDYYERIFFPLMSVAVPLNLNLATSFFPQDRTIQLWNPHRGVRIKSYAGHGYEVRDVAVSEDNSR
jgi:mitogen-activated protein kinase organizer 1